MIKELRGLTFSSDFDSGNLESVEFDDDRGEYLLLLSKDGPDTDYSTWFYFSISGGKSGETIKLSIVNMNKQAPLYSYGFRPVFQECFVEGNTEWARTINPVKSKSISTGFSISWSYTFPSRPLLEKVSFAFCYPYSYEDIQAKLDSIISSTPASNIYLFRETLAVSIEGRNVDILTITSRGGIVEDKYEELLVTPCIFPLRHESNFVGRPNLFTAEKQIVFVSCRVHPGETPGQFVFDGFLDFVLNKSDPRAAMLRDLFIFKFVPVINPDGVSRGHYRTDTNGMNLNRCYQNPDPFLHPTIHAIRSLLLYYGSLGNLFMYLDVHAHANKRGVFFYGNHLPSLEQQSENVLYAHLVSLNTPFLDLDACCFTEKNMKSKDKRDGLSKEGSGRVAMFQALNLTHSYTIEANYNDCKQVNNIELLGDDPPRNTTISNPKLTPIELKDTGKACAIALLDIKEQNPLSRIVKSNYTNLNGLRLKVISSLKQDPTYQEAAKSSFKTLSNKIKNQLSLNNKDRPRPNSVPLISKTFTITASELKKKTRSNSLNPLKDSIKDTIINKKKSISIREDNNKNKQLPSILAKDYLLSLEGAISRIKKERKESSSLIPKPK